MKNYRSTKPTWRPARLVEGKEWYIVYYSFDTGRNELRRVKVKCNYITSISARRKWAKSEINRLNSKLAEGWSPFNQELYHREKTLVVDALQEYLRHRSGAPDTQRVYKSVVAMLTRWLKLTKKRGSLEMHQFTREHAAEYLNYVEVRRKVGPRTYNNYMLFCRTIWYWFVEFNYAQDNAFSGFRRKPVRPKRRQPIPPRILSEIFEYFEKRNPAMRVACLLIYLGGVRRTELCRLQLRDFDLDAGQLIMHADITKVGVDRAPVLTDALVGALLNYGVGTLPGKFYLLSSGGYKGRPWTPGVKSVSPKMLTDWWALMRKDLGLSSEYQLYSLRDTGIQSMLRRGVPIDIVSAQFGHHSLTETYKYTVNKLAGGDEILKRMAEEF